MTFDSSKQLESSLNQMWGYLNDIRSDSMTKMCFDKERCLLSKEGLQNWLGIWKHITTTVTELEADMHHVLPLSQVHLVKYECHASCCVF